jgi:hypothetical protein
MQSTAEQKENCSYKRDEGDGIERNCVLHERYVFADFKKFHSAGFFLTMGA